MCRRVSRCMIGMRSGLPHEGKHAPTHTESVLPTAPDLGFLECNRSVPSTHRFLIVLVFRCSKLFPAYSRISIFYSLRLLPQYVACCHRTSEESNI